MPPKYLKDATPVANAAEVDNDFDFVAVNVDGHERLISKSLLITALGIVNQGISNPSVAYITNNGNNATAAIGNPSLPYLTAQAAWDAGARRFRLGVGAFSILHVATGGSEEVFVAGEGPTTTFILEFHGTAGANGVDGVGAGDSGSAGDTGTQPNGCILHSDHSCGITFVTMGGAGGTGGAAGPPYEDFYGDGGNGGDAGPAGTASLHHVTGSATSAVGSVGAGGYSVSTSGSPGNAPIEAPEQTTAISCNLSGSTVGITVVGSVIDGLFTA